MYKSHDNLFIYLLHIHHIGILLMKYIFRDIVVNTATQQQATADPKAVLLKALLNAGKHLGLSKAEIGRIIGKDRTSLNRGIDPASKSGELALLLIRVYRSLHVLVGGQADDIKHWIKTENLHTQGVPCEQLQTIQGLTLVLEYLDAIRGKV